MIRKRIITFEAQTNVQLTSEVDMNLLTQGLAVQQLQVKANALELTDADLANIKDAGLRVVHHGDNVKDISDVLARQAKRRALFADGPEAA